MELILVALATFVLWEYVGTVSPFRMSPKISPVVVSGLAYGLTYVDTKILLAVAATGVAAILHKIVMSEPDEGKRFSFPLRSRGETRKVVPPGVGARIPKL